MQGASAYKTSVEVAWRKQQLRDKLRNAKTLLQASRLPNRARDIKADNLGEHCVCPVCTRKKLHQGPHDLSSKDFSLNCKDSRLYASHRVVNHPEPPPPSSSRPCHPPPPPPPPPEIVPDLIEDSDCEEDDTEQWMDESEDEEEDSLLLHPVFETPQSNKEDEVITTLGEELFNQKIEGVHFEDYLAELAKTATEQDTLNAYEKIKKYIKQIPKEQFTITRRDGTDEVTLTDKGLFMLCMLIDTPLSHALWSKAERYIETRTEEGRTDLGEFFCHVSTSSSKRPKQVSLSSKSLDQDSLAHKDEEQLVDIVDTAWRLKSEGFMDQTEFDEEAKMLCELREQSVAETRPTPIMTIRPEIFEAIRELSKDGLRKRKKLNNTSPASSSSSSSSSSSDAGSEESSSSPPFLSKAAYRNKKRRAKRRDARNQTTTQ